MCACALVCARVSRTMYVRASAHACGRARGRRAYKRTDGARTMGPSRGYHSSGTISGERASESEPPSRHAGPTTRGPMPLKKDNRLLIYDLDSLASSPSTFRLSPLRALLVISSFAFSPSFLSRFFSLYLPFSSPLRDNRLVPRARARAYLRGTSTRGGRRNPMYTVPFRPQATLLDARSTPTVEFFTGFPGRNINFEAPS